MASGMSGNPAQAEVNARALSDRYDQLIRDATREDLRLAWEAARKRQADQEMGSEAWATKLSKKITSPGWVGTATSLWPPRSASVISFWICNAQDTAFDADENETINPLPSCSTSLPSNLEIFLLMMLLC